MQEIIRHKDCTHHDNCEIEIAGQFSDNSFCCYEKEKVSYIKFVSGSIVRVIDKGSLGIDRVLDFINIPYGKDEI